MGTRGSGAGEAPAEAESGTGREAGAAGIEPAARPGAKRIRMTAVAAWESLFRAQVAVMRTLAAEFPTKDISFNEYDVLFNLSRQPHRELRLRDLNRHVLLTQPSVSRLVDRLVAQGLVAKCPEPTDARGTVIRLTDRGYELFRRVAVEHMKTITERVGGRLDEEELERLAELCDKLRGEPQTPPHLARA